MAIAKFTEGINLYQKHSEPCLENEEVRAIVINLYTNRGLANHQIDNQVDCFNDVNYVLTAIDPNNTKALFRRAYCYKLKSQLSLAVADLELLVSLDNNK